MLEPRSSHCSHVRSPEAANRATIKQHIFGIRKSKYTEYIMCPSHGIAVILPMLAYNTKQSISMMCNWYDIFQLQDIYIRWPLDTKKNVKGIHLCYTVSCDFGNKEEQLLNFKFQWSIRWSLSLLIWKRMKSLFIFQKRYNIQPGFVSQVDMFVLLYISVQFEDYNLAHVDCKMINEKISFYHDGHQSLRY